MKIKVGDVFYENHGLAFLYQVVKVYESGRVRIRRIKEKELGWINDYEKEIIPDIDNFSHGDGVCIKDNSKGTIKKLIFYKDKVYIDLGTHLGSLWDGKPIISSYYYIWLK